jgi:hypothetical protein
VADLGAVIHFGRVKMKPGYVSYNFLLCWLSHDNVTII